MANATEIRITLRLPDDLRDRIKASAETSGRSMNAEIVLALDQAFPDPQRVEKEGKFRIIHFEDDDEIEVFKNALIEENRKALLTVVERMGLKRTTTEDDQAAPNAEGDDE